ncbi:unnamed protein product [Rhizoctonia solani]|uniref:Uncharacterized protein n=1 Tax=Rhizoctonia solani TaxID=456999 RepID=A0A8H3CLJ3_9AGAM|nr:unnamed protein product [Rhizoctonia solani]
MPPPLPPRALPLPQAPPVALPPEPQIPEAEFSNELLVTYISTTGEEECAVVQITDTYEELLAEACLNLVPWLPADWQERRRDLAREVRNRKGEVVWAAVQPSLVVELGRLGRLPELRLRIHPPAGNGSSSTQNNLPMLDERSPAYEAQPQQSAVDGIVQAVLHKLFNENPGNNAQVSGSEPPVMTQDVKSRLQELEDAFLAAESPAPVPPSHDTLNSPKDPPVLPSNTAVAPNLPDAATRRAREPENNQLPTPQSPRNRITSWINESAWQSSSTSHSQGTDLPTPPGDRSSAPTVSIDSTLQASADSMAEGQHESAIRTLLSACNNSVSPKDRAQLFLWLGQINCEIKECTNASANLAVARNLFTSLEDRAGRIECDMVLARVARQRDSGTLGADSRLREMLAEAKRHRLKTMEIKLLCEICQLACATKDIRDDLFTLSEQAKASAQKLGDLWLKAEASRTSGMVSEAKDDPISALQAYSGALELYRGAKSGKAQSPISPIKEVEMDIQRIKHTLSGRTEKPKSRFRKFF